MRRIVAVAAALVLGGCASLPEFNFDRYAPTSLHEAEHPADGTCEMDHRPGHTLDMSLPALRLAVDATQAFRPIAGDARQVIDDWAKSRPGTTLARYDEEVLVRVDGQPRWLAIQAKVAPYWRRELADGQRVWLYVSRVGCTHPIDRTADRAILSINEFQTEPYGQPEPTP